MNKVSLGKIVKVFKEGSSIELLYKGCDYIDNTNPDAFVLEGFDEIGEYTVTFFRLDGWDYKTL